MFKYKPYCNLCIGEIPITDSGNENRNVVSFYGKSLTVFNKPSNPYNTVNPIDIIKYHYTIPAFDCFAVKFWKKGDEHYKTYINDVIEPTVYSSSGIIG